TFVRKIGHRLLTHLVERPAGCLLGIANLGHDATRVKPPNPGVAAVPCLRFLWSAARLRGQFASADRRREIGYNPGSLQSPARPLKARTPCGKAAIFSRIWRGPQSRPRTTLFEFN